MRPLRRTILQFSQMRLTLERTFMTTAALPSDAATRPTPTDGSERAIKSGLPFPKTRRVVFLKNKPAALPGWVELRVE